MEAYALDAVDLARERFQIELDFSEGSIEKVERILANYHNSLPKGVFGKLFGRGPSNDAIWQFAKIWGGYVGEVIRRRWGGEWALESAAFPGQQMITLKVRGQDIFPPSKAGKRMVNGPEDDIWLFYQVVKRDFERTEV